MKAKFHAIAGTIALSCILGFWMSTLISEVFLSTSSVLAVKRGILMAMCVLIPAMTATGASGFALARGRTGRLLSKKQRRMKFIAGNGLLVLLPCAITLFWMADAGRFVGWFYTIQVVELVAGAVNIVLLGLNMRDGLRLSGRLT